MRDEHRRNLWASPQALIKRHKTNVITAVINHTKVQPLVLLGPQVMNQKVV